MWPQTNFEKRVFIKMVLKTRRSKSQVDLRKENRQKFVIIVGSLHEIVI